MKTFPESSTALTAQAEHSQDTAYVPALPRPSYFFVASLLLLLFFAAWTWFTLNGEQIDSFDRWCAQSIHQWTAGASHTRVTDVMVYITDIGGVAALTLMAIMGGIWQNAIGHRYLAVAWLIVILGCAMLNGTTKWAFNRDRPAHDIRDSAVRENNKSYPSGHSMGSAVGYGMLGYALILPQRRRPRRIAALLLTGGMIVAVGLSRIYLRAHWFSDVVAGWAIGMCWLCFCLGWLELRRQKATALK